MNLLNYGNDSDGGREMLQSVTAGTGLADSARVVVAIEDGTPRLSNHIALKVQRLLPLAKLELQKHGIIAAIITAVGRAFLPSLILLLRILQ